MYRISRRRRVLALALAATTTLTVAVVTAPARAQTVGPLRTGENFRLGGGVDQGRARDIPGLAVNPADRRHIVAVWVDVNATQCQYDVSLDGGATWTGGSALPPAPGFPSPTSQNPNPHCDSAASAPFDGGVAWGSGQNVYASYSPRRSSTQGESVVVNRSRNGGRSFEPAVVAINAGATATPRYFRPEVAVQPGAGAGGADRVYVSAQAASAAGNRTVVAVSNDAGATWGPVVEVAGAGVVASEPSAPVVTPDGAVNVAYRTAGASAFVAVARSTDAGLTWTTRNAVPVQGYNDGVSSFASTSFPRMSADQRNGALYITYMQGPPAPGLRQDHFIHPDVDVLLVSSKDGGTTWSGAVRINDDPVGTGTPGVGPAQRHPKVLVAPNGRVDVVWHDRRHGYRSPTQTHQGNGEAKIGDTYYAYSLDGGATFSANRRISDKSQNLDIGLDRVFFAYWSWGPTLVHTGDDEVLFAWMESRDGNVDNENEDIYLARLNLRAPDVLPVQRLPETSRSSLSVALSRYAYQGGAQAILNTGLSSSPATRVVVVNEGDTAGALAGAVLSRAHLGPLLVSPASGLTPELKAEVRRMSPLGAFVIGGDASLGTRVVSDLVEAGIGGDAITRLSGDSSADTARLIALNLDRRNPDQRSAGVPAVDAAVIVNPAGKDAGAAAGLAAHRRLPILFTDRDAVPAATRAALTALNVTTTLVVGGPGSVSDAVAASLPGARRLGGADAAAVSEAVVAESVARSLPTNIVVVADTEQPLDAALAGAALGRTGGLLLLAPGGDTAVAEQALVRRGLRPGVDRLVVARSLPGFGGRGYRLVARDGGIFAFGGAGFFGSTGAMRLNQPVVGSATTPSNNGYWLTAADGGVFAFGDARFRGSTGALRLAKPVVGMTGTPSGNGYWLVASDGGVFAFGDARFFGSTGSLRLAQPIVGMAATPTGNGYWLVASDGGVFAFGDAAFRGSTGALRLAQPVVGLGSTPSGNGYWLVASDGGIFAFGDAPFVGSTGALRLARPVVGMDATASGRGYLLTASDGGVFAFGDAVFAGSTGALRLAQPVVGITAGP